MDPPAGGLGYNIHMNTNADMTDGIFLAVWMLSTLFGIYVLRRPERIIKFQQWAYALVNWRMEPIDYPKEVRNTRLMGLFLVLFALAALIYYCLQ